MVPAGIPGHLPGVGAPYDPLLARQKLAEAGYPGGAGFPEVEFLLMGGFSAVNAFEGFIEQWVEHVGLVIDPRPIDLNSLLERLRADPPPRWILSFGADYPDPNNFMRSSSWLKNGGWQHPEYERLIREARHVTERRRRMEIYRRAEKILAMEVPAIPLGYARNHILLKPWVTSWPSSVAKGTMPKDLVIEPH